MVIVGTMSGCLAVSPRNTVSAESDSGSSVGVKAVSNKKELVVGELFQYTLVIKGEFPTAPQVFLPDLKAFSVAGNKQTKGYSRDGKTTQVYFLFEYTLKPKQAGTLTILPARVLSQGKSYESEPITLTVREPSPVERLRKENPSDKTTL